MRRRLFVFWVVLLCALGALLLLSALIQTPVEEDAAPAELPVAHTITAFAGMPPTPASGFALPPGAWLRAAALFTAAIVLLPRLHCTCDANGRVLSRRSYIRSYHPVFKQEFACG
ncbi:MAG: hypothetical protein JW811_07420 [Clostridiales bacterium]|nr:hypothetical protein [Clostridiales bacterium]